MNVKSKINCPIISSSLVEQDSSSLAVEQLPFYSIVCSKCGKKTAWLDPRESNDIVECIHCGYEMELLDMSKTSTIKGDK